MQTAARAPLCLLQVSGFLIKNARFSGKIEGPKHLLKSTGGASQPAGTFGAPWGPLKQGPTHSYVKSLYQQCEEYEASNY